MSEELEHSTYPDREDLDLAAQRNDDLLALLAEANEKNRHLRKTVGDMNQRIHALTVALAVASGAATVGPVTVSLDEDTAS